MEGAEIPEGGRGQRLPVSRLVLLMAVLIGVDQWTKQLARTQLVDATRHFLGGVLTLLYAENEGAFLSIGSALPATARTAIFSGVVGLVLVIALVALVTGRISGRDSIAVALIIGGGIGNLIDRVARGGRVTDFAYLSLGPLHTGVFNVADVAITAGVIWIAVSAFFVRDRKS
jgi:signal peptidase II